MTRRAPAISALLACGLVLLLASPAFGYDEPANMTVRTGLVSSQLRAVPQAGAARNDLHLCHAPHMGNLGQTAAKGPHGLYSATTDRCDACHDVHDAGGALLLPAATSPIRAARATTALAVKGVYGAIEARTGVDPDTAAWHARDRYDQRGSRRATPPPAVRRRWRSGAPAFDAHLRRLPQPARQQHRRGVHAGALAHDLPGNLPKPTKTSICCAEAAGDTATVVSRVRLGLVPRLPCRPVIRRRGAQPSGRQHRVSTSTPFSTTRSRGSTATIPPTATVLARSRLPTAAT